jgi:serine/threonine-protein kinase
MNDEWGAQLGQILGKKYLVRRVLGAGGMGVVYEVEHVLTKRLGALKMLRREVASQARIVERFVREASAAGHIGSPHIVETWDAGELPSGEPYMFMELLEGSPVRELIAQRGRLRFAEAREIVCQAASGLAAAHAAGIVHRDVKPENLFVCRGQPPLVKLIDFGISKFEALPGNLRLTAEGTPLGTPYYMSPEQVAGQSDVDVRTDVYSLGVVLYECLTGRVPYDASTLSALSLRIFAGNFTPARELAPHVPAGLDAVLSRAMAVEPSQRYANMQAFREALEQLPAPALEHTTEIAGEPVVGRSESPADFGEPSPVAPAKRSRFGMVLGIFALLTAVVAGFWAMSAEPAPPAAPEAEASAPVRALPAAPVVATTSAPRPDIAPSSRAPEAPPQTPAAEVVRKPSASAPQTPRPLAPAPSAAPATRAARDGLSEQNPFEK